MPQAPVSNSSISRDGQDAVADPPNDSPRLTAVQLHALFDILTHYETYDEVEQFKYSKTITRYGYPFVTTTGSDSGGDASPPGSYATQSAAPLLATLLRTVVLPLPGVRDLPPEFWNVRFQGIMIRLADAELSESYDKGVLGTRKILATAASVIHESVTRGCFGGVPSQGEKRNLARPYDPAKAEDLVAGWENGVHELVYGNLIDELFKCAVEKESLEEHSPGVRAAADYIIVHLASFVHYIFIVSPEGQYLLKLVENVHKLIPYSMIKQTLRIGNVATMLNGMMKLLLAKMGVGALSNWIGLTHNADDGMNLLQRIISLVLSWDSSEFRKTADRVEKAGAGPSKEHLGAIKDFIALPRAQHEALRGLSKEKPESIVAAIFEQTSPDLLNSLSEAQHTQCLDYYSAHLSIRDREQLTQAFCRGNPDHFTQALRDLVAAFEPIIRSIHGAIDIREHMSAMEGFLNDFLSVSKARKGSTSSGGGDGGKTAEAPSVEDYVALFQRNRQLLYNWLHQFASKCPEVRESFREWANSTMKVFKQELKTDSEPAGNSAEVHEDEVVQRRESLDQPWRTAQRLGAAGNMSAALQQLFNKLPAKTQQEVLGVLDAHAEYLKSLENLSMRRMQRVLANLAERERDMPEAEHLKPPSSPARFLWPSSGSSTPKTISGANTPLRGPSSMSGPGVFIARWQALLDTTLITPSQATGAPPRTGKDVKGSTAQGKVGVAGLREAWNSAYLAGQVEADVPAPPDVRAALRALSQGFHELVVDIANSRASAAEAGSVKEKLAS